MFIGQFLKGNNMVQLRLQYGRYYAHAQVLNSSIDLIRMFYGQFLKGNIMVQLRLRNGRYYALAQVLNAYNFCLS